MPMNRYEIRNEYSLADPELYRAADKDDPEALLEGVAMAGLVGVLRQLGDLAEFAAEIFHDLHEEVMATAARGHGLMIRVQQLEAEVPFIEKTFLSQTDHSSSFYNSGADWHPNIRISQNLVTQGDLPRFIMDSCEECRGPPRLFLLDKFDVGGAGACLKRYTDPSFFKVETSGMTGAEVQREKKIRKAKKKGPRWRNGETPEVLPASHAKLHQLFLDEHVENGAKNPARRAKLKRKLNGFPFDSKTGKSYMEKLLRTPSPDHKMLDEVVISSSSLMLPLNDLSDSGVDIPEVGPLSHYHEHVVAKSTPSTERGGLMVNSSTSESNEISTDDNLWEAHNSYNNIVINDISPTFDKQVTDEEDRPMDGERKTEGSLIGSQSDDISSEIDNYVDAPSTMGSEIDTDSELRMKGDFSSPYMKSKPSISDANEDRLLNRSSDSQSTGESTMSDEGFSSLKKEISSFSLSDSPSASVENSNPEKHYVEGFPAADSPEIDKVDASHPDEDFEKDQHGRPIFLDDTCRDTDVISDHIFDLHLQNSSVDQIISEPLPEPEEVVREGRLREPESSEIVDTLDDNEKDTEQVVHPTCSLSASDSESQLGDDSLGFPAGKHAGDESNGEAYTSNGNEIKPELVMLQTSSPCISDSTSESGDDSLRSSAGEQAIEESNSDNIFCTFTLSDTLCHTKDGSAAVSADLLPQDDPDQHDHDSPVSSDGEHPVDKLNSDDTPCASTVSEALHPTTEGLAAASADLLHEEDADQHDQYLIENESSTLISCEILSQKERDTLKMISMESPVPGKLEDDIPKMSDHHIAHSVEDILPTVSRGEKLLNELDHSKISSDASDYPGCISGSNPVKEFTEASLPEKQNLEDADNCSITAADDQMDPVNLISSHVEDAHSWPITGPCHGGTRIIPEEEATLSETPATGSSVSVEVVGLQEIETTDDSAVLENPLNLEVTAGASDIVEKDGIPEIPSGVEVTEILGSADLSSEKEGNVLLDKSDDVPPHEYTADPEHLGTLESLNEAHVILNESDGHIFPNKSDAVTKNESLADLKCPGDPEETAKSSIMLGSDGITSSPSGLKVTEIVGFADVNLVNEVDVLLDESFSLKEHEDSAPVSSPLSAAADNSDTDGVNLPADLDKSVAGHNQCCDHSYLHVLGNDLNCLSGSRRESCLSENFSHREAATGAAFGVPLSTDQPKSEESDAASASCLDPVIEHSLQIPDDSAIPTLEQSGFDTEQDSFQENDIANHVSGNDLNCLSGSQRESSLSSAFSHREDATLNPGSDINTPCSTDQPKSEGSDAVVACFDPIIDHSLQVGDDATIPSTLEQSGFDPEHDSFHENDTAYHVSGASYLPIDYNAERTVFQDKIELPPTQPDDEVLLAGEACSQLSTFCHSNPLQMPSPDDNEVDNKSDPTFPHVNNNPGPPSLSVFPGISNYEGNVPGNPMGLDSIFPQNSLFSETNHIKLDELPPLPPLPPVQWRMGKFQHVSFTVDKELVKQELPSERISPPTACTVEDNSYLEETHSSLIQIAPPLAPKEEKVELKMSDSAVNSLHEIINLPQDIGDKLQQPTASGNDVGFLLEEVDHSLTQIAPAIASKEEKVVNSSSSIEVDAIRETVKIIPMTENQSLLSLPSNDDVTSLHGENNRSLIKISNQSSSSLETSTTEETSDPPLQPFMPSSEAKFASPEDKVQNESGTVKLPRPRNPLIDAVAAIDRSKLRKVTERVRPQVQKVDERDSILEQIRTKSFNLKPTVASRPSFRGPGTNLKVAAILEKANAIRQALAGSDEDDEDSWSDS